MPSKALEINLASSRVHVTVDPRYDVLRQVLDKYQGASEGMQTFLEELCHPYKNWEFIIKEARAYALNYFHLLTSNPRGPEAVGLYMDIFLEALVHTKDVKLRIRAVDNLLLLIQKVLKESGIRLKLFLPFLNETFDQIRLLPKDLFSLFVKSFYQLNKLAGPFAEAVSEEAQRVAFTRLLSRHYQYTYAYLLAQPDPFEQFVTEAQLDAERMDLRAIFQMISHERLASYQTALERFTGSEAGSLGKALEDMIGLPGFGQIVAAYGRVPRQLLKLEPDKGVANQWKLIFLLHIMNNGGLTSIHEETLRDINRTLVWLTEHETPPVIQASLEKTFAILRTSVTRFPETALHCVLNMGRGVYKTDDSDLVDYFTDALISLGFQSPDIRGVGDDWQIRSNAFHIQNIRTWLELIELNPKWSKKLLSSLIIHLSLEGVLIKDTDLFPRDITRLLNSHIGPVYNLAKQLCRLFPSFFNDIGAEGRLRDISTKIDEINLRKDPLVHFLRKQSHVESSNRIVGLMEGVLDFWRTRDKNFVRKFVPPNIYRQIETESPYVDGVHHIVKQVMTRMGRERVSAFLDVNQDVLNRELKDLPNASDPDVERVGLAIEFYKILYQKYHLRFTETGIYLGQLQATGLPELKALREALGEEDLKRKLTKVLDYLEKLKALILSPGVYESREDIYRKRHFTVDIPSMYGSYHEMRFDALGLTFRLESVVNVIFDELVERLDFRLITRATFTEIYDCLLLFDRALKLDGISSLEMEKQLDFLAHSLNVRGFSETQYLDIFRGFSQAVRNITNDYFNNIHEENLFRIIDANPLDRLHQKYRSSEHLADREKRNHRISEVFLRDRIASALALQQLDLFLTRILNTLHQQSDDLPRDRLRLLLSYDPQRVIAPVEPGDNGFSDIIHLGNKGLNLVKLKSCGLPVPPGFIVTTEVFRCRVVVEDYGPAKHNFAEQVARALAEVERATGKKFGDPRNPLLLSVRSGSSISQPGMMDTFLNVGINEAVVMGMAARTGNEWFAWDTYRRFLQTYGMAFGLMRDQFDAIIAGHKKRAGIDYKRNLPGRQMRDVALAYKALLVENGISIEEDPFQQLMVAIGKVFDSWNTPKANTYRKIMSISDDWGTAVTVQAMVFGNLSPNAGSGVFFTHNPRWSGDMLVPWGDYSTENQGEDVVSGLVQTHPISRKQADTESRDPEQTLEVRFPAIYQALRTWAKQLIYERQWGPQEMEFTFEETNMDRLYLLQTRDMVMREREKVYSFDKTAGMPIKFLGHGIGVSGGAMAGRVVFTSGEIRDWREKEPDTSLILVRGDTVPDDIKEVSEADGLLTARGGSTSHASIVAHRLGKTCVVGCNSLVCMEKEKMCSLDQMVLRSGDWISIDGREGSVYLGQMKIREMESHEPT